MRRIIFSSAICHPVTCFSTVSRKQHDFRKKKKLVEYKICDLNFSTSFTSNISHCKKNSVKYFINVRRPSCKVPVFSCQILMKLECSRQSSEKYSNVKFYETPSSGNRVVPLGQGDMTKLIVTFRSYAKALKSQLVLHSKHTTSRLWRSIIGWTYAEYWTIRRVALFVTDTMTSLE
jgi:hypothetical protein